MENLDTNVIQAATAGFNLPHDVVQLPTGGLFYKNKQKSVKMGYLTASDENLISDAIQRKNDSLVLGLIRSKLYEHDFKVNELLEEDIEALLIFLRNSSFGPEYSLNLTDPGTGKEFSAQILLDELNIKQPNVKPNSDGTFDVKLPKTESVVKIRPITYFEKTEIESMTQSYPQGRVAPTVTWRLNKQILQLNGSEDRNQISTFIENLPIMDSKFIRNFLTENVPSLDLKRQIQAPSGEMVNINITFGVEFFRPFF